jgi:hypothetical protein
MTPLALKWIRTLFLIGIPLLVVGALLAFVPLVSLGLSALFAAPIIAYLDRTRRAKLDPAAGDDRSWTRPISDAAWHELACGPGSSWLETERVIYRIQNELDRPLREARQFADDALDDGARYVANLRRVELTKAAFEADRISKERTERDLAWIRDGGVTKHGTTYVPPADDTEDGAGYEWEELGGLPPHLWRQTIEEARGIFDPGGLQEPIKVKRAPRVSFGIRDRSGIQNRYNP